MEHVGALLIYDMEQSGLWDVVEGSLLCHTFFCMTLFDEAITSMDMYLTCLLVFLTIFLMDLLLCDPNDDWVWVL